MLPVSAVIIAFNEEKNIRDCLESVKWADEIVVVDSGSTDKTLEIAREYTDKIYTKEWAGYSRQREYSLEKVRNDWVISIDADERVSTELREEIFALQKAGFTYSGYFMPRRNYFLGKHIKSCFWYPDYQLRLFNKQKAKVTDRKVHEGFEVEGDKTNLKSDLIHHTHPNITEVISKINTYSSLEAEEYAGRRKVTGKDIILHPVAAFLNHFISRKGYRDGIHGMMISIVHAMTNMLKYMKMWEIQNKRNKPVHGEKK